MGKRQTAFDAHAATAYAKIARLTNANIAAAAHCATARASAENAVASLNAARSGACSASVKVEHGATAATAATASTAATAVASATAAAKTADAAVAAADHARAAAQAAVEATEAIDAENRKQEATYTMIERLLFDRDPVEDCYDGKFTAESVGALTWTENGGGRSICCPISNVGFVTEANSLRDFSCSVREYTVAAHGDIRDFPGSLRGLSERLRSAADAADAAGFDKLPGGVEGYSPTHDAFVAAPPTLAQLSEGAAKLVRELHLCRSVGEDDRDDNGNDRDDIGNVSWVTGLSVTCHCPISGVLDMYRKGILFTPLAAAHTALADKYGSLQAFPQRLRELSERMRGAAASAANLGFLNIPGEEPDADEDEDEGEGEGGDEGGHDEEEEDDAA